MNVRRIQEQFGILMAACAVLSVAAVAEPSPADTAAIEKRPRVIVTTDGEADDQCSMVRYLLHADQFRTRGLIYSSSKHHWAGNRETAAYKWHGTDWIETQLAAYREVYPTLKTHAEFPPPDELLGQVAIGNIATEGEMSEDTPGARHIATELLKPEEDPVWLLAWGGANTIARALKIIADEHPESAPEVSRRARIYLISEQDQTFRDYIAPNWPDVTTLICNASTYGAIAYRWELAIPDTLHTYFSASWLSENLLNGHGSLAAHYVPRKDGAFRSEGDSPAFLHLVDTGLRAGEAFEQGSWGGQFRRSGTVWKSISNSEPFESTLVPWIAAMQNEFAARADWCVGTVAEANHPPEVTVEGPLHRAARPGERISIKANARAERPGESFTFRWYQDTTAGESTALVLDAGTSSGTVAFDVPNKPDATYPIIVEVSDNGQPPLTRWRRVVIQVGS